MIQKIPLLKRILRYGRSGLLSWNNELRIVRMALQVKQHCWSDSSQKPIVFFHASTRITDLSLNAAFSLIASWATRLAGVPVVHFVCRNGMSLCVQGTNRDDFYKHPPCKICSHHSRIHYTAAQKHYFDYIHDEALDSVLKKLILDELIHYKHEIPIAWHLPVREIPLGKLTLPSIRWILRRHNLLDDELKRYLYREYILSAWNVAQKFYDLVNQIDPQQIVVFNGQFFPEATVRWIAQQRGLRVITHEVGLAPMTGFFTDGEATIYPIQIPEDFNLNQAQNDQLDSHLNKRFQGKFSMAGINFWPEMRNLDGMLLKAADQFNQIVPIFTNVIFDTSQPHSNTIFTDMFAWLDLILETAHKHPETLFVIRAHPDETRPGKTSAESVAMWIKNRRADELSNIMFISPIEYISSYELIQRSKFVMIYNSTIGLEASIIGKPVLSAGRSRFTDYQTVFYPSTLNAYCQQFEKFLKAGQIEVEPEHKHQARRFLFYQIFRMSLPFNEYLETGNMPGFVFLKRFNWQSIQTDSSTTIQAIMNGLINNKQFELEEC